MTLASLDALHQDLVGLQVPMGRDNISDLVVLNSNHPLVGWVVARIHEQGVESDQVARLIDLLRDAVRYPGIGVEPLSEYLQAWRDATDLADTCPPNVSFERRLESPRLSGIWLRGIGARVTDPEH